MDFSSSAGPLFHGTGKEVQKVNEQASSGQYVFFAGSWTDVRWISNKDACLTTCFSNRVPCSRFLAAYQISGHRDVTKLPMRGDSASMPVIEIEFSVHIGVCRSEVLSSNQRSQAIFKATRVGPLIAPRRMASHFPMLWDGNDPLILILRYRILDQQLQLPARHVMS